MSKWNFPYWEFNTITWSWSSNGLQHLKSASALLPLWKRWSGSHTANTIVMNKLVQPHGQCVQTITVSLPNQTQGCTIYTNPMINKSESHRDSMVGQSNQSNGRIHGHEKESHLSVTWMTVLLIRMGQKGVRVRIIKECSPFSLSVPFFQWFSGSVIKDVR